MARPADQTALPQNRKTWHTDADLDDAGPRLGNGDWRQVQAAIRDEHALAVECQAHGKIEQTIEFSQAVARDLTGVRIDFDNWWYAVGRNRQPKIRRNRR